MGDFFGQLQGSNLPERGGMDERRIPRIGVEPRSPDFVRLAESLGCHATRAASAGHFSQAVREALAADRPTLIEVREDSPWLRA